MICFSLRFGSQLLWIVFYFGSTISILDSQNNLFYKEITVEIENKVRKYVEENFMRSSGDSSLSDDKSLLESGIIDSAGIFELVVFLEKEFSVTISDEDIVPDNFENVSCISNMIKSKAG